MLLKKITKISTPTQFGRIFNGYTARNYIRSFVYLFAKKKISVRRSGIAQCRVFPETFPVRPAIPGHSTEKITRSVIRNQYKTNKANKTEVNTKQTKTQKQKQTNKTNKTTGARRVIAYTEFWI